jgi:hypothetical protein
MEICQRSLASATATAVASGATLQMAIEIRRRSAAFRGRTCDNEKGECGHKPWRLCEYVRRPCDFCLARAIAVFASRTTLNAETRCANSVSKRWDARKIAYSSTAHCLSCCPVHPSRAIRTVGNTGETLSVGLGGPERNDDESTSLERI